MLLTPRTDRTQSDTGLIGVSAGRAIGHVRKIVAANLYSAYLVHLTERGRHVAAVLDRLWCGWPLDTMQRYKSCYRVRREAKVKVLCLPLLVRRRRVHRMAHVKNAQRDNTSSKF